MPIYGNGTTFRGERKNDAGRGIYGNGNDGAGANPTSPLTRDMFYASLTLTGYSLDCGGFRIYVSGVLSVDATSVLHANGASASAGAGGAARATGTLRGGGAGGNAGATGVAGGASASPAKGGAGGAGGSVNGGAGGTVGAPITTHGDLRNLLSACTAMFCGYNSGGGMQSVRAGGGGGGGGNGSGTGGGGGASGGVLHVLARVITVASGGVISANGGNGGNASGTLGNGGGAGGGGVVIAVYNRYTGAAPTVTAGTPGTGSAGGVSGVAGAAGTYYAFKQG